VAADREELLAGRYRKLGTIGTGGMARVVLAEDERLGRKVAIKRLHADSPAETAKRFDREARLGASLNHPNIVAIYDVDSDAEEVLIVMEYVEGETLKQALGRGPLDPSIAASVIADVASALDHAHADGVVHRDVKPANILLRSDGVAKLADLGIATAAEGTQITATGMVVGTASYMSPEQLGGDEVGPASDVYALAAVAYEALSGRRARQGSNAVEVAHQTVNEAPPDLRDVWPDGPAGAASVIRRGMAMAPEDRPSGGELATELRESLAGGGTPGGDATEATRAMPVSRPVPPPPMPVRDPAPRAPADAPARRVAADAPAPRDPVHARAQRDPVDPPGARGGRGRPRWLGLGALAALILVAVVAIALASGGEEPASDRAAGSGAQGSPGGAEREPAPAEDPAPGEGEPAPAEEAAPEEEPAPAEEAAPEEEPAPEETEIDPAAGAELDSQAFALIQQERYAEAVPIAQRAVASFPEGSTEQNYAFALYNLGTALNRSGSPDEAIPFLEKRLAISDDRRKVVQQELDAAREAAG